MQFVDILEHAEPGAAVARPDTGAFELPAWNGILPQLAEQYRSASPFPHIELKDFLNCSIASQMAAEFPAMGNDSWIQYKHKNENKVGMPDRSLFPPLIGQVVDQLNSPAFVAWVSVLTGIPNLLADPSLEGGGLHQSGRGGFLNVNTDFSTHHYNKNWRRRVNLILYLNPEWREDWGGSLEFWDTSMRCCAAKYLPLLNHAVIFNTDEKSLHGFPDPLTCPDGTSRKSLALYFYTEEREAPKVHSTDYRPRPTDSAYQSMLIWLDKMAVDVYSRAKARLGFSDDFASRVLGFFSRKK